MNLQRRIIKILRLGGSMTFEELRAAMSDIKDVNDIKSAIMPLLTVGDLFYTKGCEGSYFEVRKDK